MSQKLESEEAFDLYFLGKGRVIYHLQLLCINHLTTYALYKALKFTQKSSECKDDPYPTEMTPDRCVKVAGIGYSSNSSLKVADIASISRSIASL